MKNLKLLTESFQTFLSTPPVNNPIPEDNVNEESQSDYFPKEALKMPIGEFLEKITKTNPELHKTIIEWIENYYDLDVSAYSEENIRERINQIVTSLKKNDYEFGSFGRWEKKHDKDMLRVLQNRLKDKFGLGEK